MAGDFEAVVGQIEPQIATPAGHLPGMESLFPHCCAQ